VKAFNASINMANVHVTTQNKASEEQMFKDWKLTNNKYVANWEAKEKLKNLWWKLDNRCRLPSDLPTIIIREWTFIWAKMPNLIKPTKPTKL
jgi:hypothetical protein